MNGDHTICVKITSVHACLICRLTSWTGNSQACIQDSVFQEHDSEGPGPKPFTL